MKVVLCHAGSPYDRSENGLRSCVNSLKDLFNHLQVTMLSDSEIVALCEVIEVHVSINPSLYATEMPIAVQERLLTATIDEASRQKLKHRAC